MTVNRVTNAMNYIRDYKFDHSGSKLCGGIYTDGKYMYVLIVSDYSG